MGTSTKRQHNQTTGGPQNEETTGRNAVIHGHYVYACVTQKKERWHHTISWHMYLRHGHTNLH